MDQTDARRRHSSKVTRRHVLLGAGATLAAATARPGPAAAQGRKGEIVAGLSERMLTLDPANHYSISATSVLRHIYDPLVDVTNDSKFVPCLAESWTRGEQHDVALHAAQGRQVPRRHAVHRGQRRLFPQARAGQHEAHQGVRLPGHRGRAEGRRLHGRRVDEVAVRLAAGAPHDAGDAAADRRPERGGLLPEARRHRPVQVRRVDPRRADHADRERRLLEAGHPQGREGDVPVHPGALDPRGRAPERASST